ncbi:galactose-1-phosphate uridylyltransferase [Jatrophihabitans sp. YIM 134969]
MTVKTPIDLADGRELIYFDDSPGADRSARDRRDLPEVHNASQVRWDPIFGDWSVIAGHRQSRTYKPPTNDCPLDPTRGERLTEIPAADYDVVVFENRFPSLATDALANVPVVEDPPFSSWPGAGRCEVVCFTSDHNTSFSGLPLSRVHTVFDAWVDRTVALSSVPSVEYVFAFENRGEEIGVTLSHPHGQIYGYPFVPARFGKVVANNAAYRADHDACLQCDVAEAERKAGERVVLDTEHVLVYVPFAARWPYEVRIVPHRHVPDLPALTDDERHQLAEVYLDVLQRFDRLFDTPAPYISGWQQAPVADGRADWHLANELFTIRRAKGKLKYLAGSESGAAVWINDVTPEQAAARLRGD